MGHRGCGGCRLPQRRREAMAFWWHPLRGPRRVRCVHQSGEMPVHSFGRCEVHFDRRSLQSLRPPLLPAYSPGRQVPAICPHFCKFERGYFDGPDLQTASTPSCNSRCRVLSDLADHHYASTRHRNCFTRQRRGMHGPNLATCRGTRLFSRINCPKLEPISGTKVSQGHEWGRSGEVIQSHE